jgi:site-specific recombinase XerD
MIEDMTLAGLAAGTQKIYIQSVRRLAAHYRRSPDQLNEEEVRAYLLGLRQGGAARGTFKTSQYGLRFLYRHTLDRVWGWFGEKRIASPRQKRLPDALSEDQVRHLLSVIRNPVHKMCLAVMYACGLRISEATTLEISAIDRANRVLRIIGKGNKERLVPLPQPVLDELGRLWRTHRNCRWLFPNRHGDAPINRRVLSNTFAAAVAAAGIVVDTPAFAARPSTDPHLIDFDMLLWSRARAGANRHSRPIEFAT